MISMKSVLVPGFLIVAVGLFGAANAQDGGWRVGRGTFYGDKPWLWDIHKGSCGFGQLDKNKGTGWDITALPDVHHEYSNSCGKCYEVKCNPAVFKDYYQNTLNRESVCKDVNTVVTVSVSDTCPCNYPPNLYSNKRWCCGDVDHLDLSFHTFDKLAERRWGVIGLLYRPVACPGSGTPKVKTDGEGSRLHWLRKAFTDLNPPRDVVQSFEG